MFVYGQSSYYFAKTKTKNNQLATFNHQIIYVQYENLIFTLRFAKDYT